MKLKKFEIVALSIAAAAVVFTAGFFIGRGNRGGEIVIDSAAGVVDASEYSAEEEKSVQIQESPEDGVMININTATEAQLETLPGIGETLSKRIVAYREKVGDFKKIEDLTGVEGIGSKKFDAVKDHITVD